MRFEDKNKYKIYNKSNHVRVYTEKMIQQIFFVIYKIAWQKKY